MGALEEHSIIETDNSRHRAVCQQNNYDSFRVELDQAVEYLSAHRETIKKNMSQAYETKLPLTIFFATGNYGKVKEFEGFLKTNEAVTTLLNGLVKFDIPPKDQIPEVEETGTTFYENSAIKSNAMSSHFKKIVLAEDSGLTVPILNNEPGVYSARYFDRNVAKHQASVFSEAAQVYMEIMSEEGRPMNERKKDGVDFMNKVMLVYHLRQLVAQSEVDVARFPAFFQTVATISGSGRVLMSGIGSLFGSVCVPQGFDIHDLAKLRALHDDFGYNSVFHVRRPKTNDHLPLNKVSIEERLKWNHRSIAMTRAVISFLASHT